MPSSRRKKVKSYNEPGHAHELTFSCFRRQAFLAKDLTCRWFIDALEATRTKHHLCLWAYVVMPEHVHVLFWPKEPKYQVSKIRSSLKLPVTNKALRHIRRHAPAFLSKLEDRQPSGAVHYRFWQRGGGYDRNVIDVETLFSMIEYIHNNPVRRGLVAEATDWIWSSARFYAGATEVPIRMDPLPNWVHSIEIPHSR